MKIVPCRFLLSSSPHVVSKCRRSDVDNAYHPSTDLVILCMCAALRHTIGVLVGRSCVGPVGESYGRRKEDRSGGREQLTGYQRGGEANVCQGPDGG